jgi:hypothetical protein
MSPHVRVVKTASGSRAVQIVYSNRRGKRDLVHIGSARTDAELAVLKAVARQQMHGSQPELDLGLAVSAERGGALPIISTRMGVLLDALLAAYVACGFDTATGGDEVFRRLVFARLIEPTSKLDSLRVMGEAGLQVPAYRTVTRALPGYALPGFRAGLSEACAARAHLGANALVLFDASTLYFETDAGDGFREPGYSKERRLEPQITIGLLTDRSGYPLGLHAFEGNKAETKTMLPVITDFLADFPVQHVTVVADAGMLSLQNRNQILDAGLSYIIGQKVPEMPHVIQQWQQEHPGVPFTDGQIFTTPMFTGPAGARREARIYYQYREGRARRTLRGIDAQIKKAETIAAGRAQAKTNKYVTLIDERRLVNRELEMKTRSLAGIKGYITSLLPETGSAQFVIDAYHQLWNIEKSFRMSKHDLAARPIYHHLRESIDAHLTIVFAALAIARHIETVTGWSIKKFIKTARRYREDTIDAGGHHILAAHPIPSDLQTALNAIHAVH